MSVQYGGARRGFNPRWIIAIIIALVGIISYYSKTEINPVTGEKQRIAMNVDQEKALGLEAAPKMAQEMGGVVPEDDSDATLVRIVGSKLVERSDAMKSPYVGNFNFHLLLDDKTINAFALPGGQIFITRGLFNKLADESQLAGVLGHEIGHVIARHSSEQMAKGGLAQALGTAFVIGASDSQGKAAMAQVAAQMASQMVMLKYGRDDEKQSDELGLKYMAQAGYDPRGMLGVMKVLKEASSGSKQPEFMSSHPLPDSRIQEIEEYIKANYPNGVPDTLTRGIVF